MSITVKEMIDDAKELNDIINQLKKYQILKPYTKNPEFVFVDNPMAFEECFKFDKREKTPEIIEFASYLNKNNKNVSIHVGEDDKEEFRSFFKDPIKTVKELKIRYRKDISEEEAYQKVMKEIMKIELTSASPMVLMPEDTRLAQNRVIKQVMDVYEEDMDKHYTEKRIDDSVMKSFIFDLKNNKHTFNFLENEGGDTLIHAHNFQGILFDKNGELKEVLSKSSNLLRSLDEFLEDEVFFDKVFEKDKERFMQDYSSFLLLVEDKEGAQSIVKSLDYVNNTDQYTLVDLNEETLPKTEENAFLVENLNDVKLDQVMDFVALDESNKKSTKLEAYSDKINMIKDLMKNEYQLLDPDYMKMEYQDRIDCSCSEPLFVLKEHNAAYVYNKDLALVREGDDPLKIDLNELDDYLAIDYSSIKTKKDINVGDEIKVDFGVSKEAVEAPKQDRKSRNRLRR